MRKIILLIKVPYKLPPPKARKTVPRLVGTNTIKVYQASPMFWTLARSGEGYRVQMGTVLGAGDNKGHEVTTRAAAEFISHTEHPALLVSQIKSLGWFDLAEELEKVGAKPEKNVAVGFAGQFTTICQRYGGVFNAADTIGDGLCFHIQTQVGLLKVSIHSSRPDKPRSQWKIASVFLRFQNYTGPTPFPYHGDFNPFSHKWNILFSAGSIAEAQREALRELELRLQLVGVKGCENL